MEERPFKGMIHLLHKRMNGITYPVTKQEIIEQIGAEGVKVDAVTEMTVQEILEPVKMEQYECAAQFYCALLGSL